MKDTMKNVIKSNINSIDLDAIGSKVDIYSNGIKAKIDSEAAKLTSKVDSLAVNSRVSTIIENTSIGIIDKLSNFFNNAIGKLSAVLESVIDKIINNSQIPSSIKAELISDIHAGLASTSTLLKKEVDNIDAKADGLVAAKLPVIEKEASGLIKKIISKITNSLDESIGHAKNDIYNFGAKLKSVTTKSSDFDHYDASNSFEIEKLDVIGNYTSHSDFAEII